MARMNQAMTDLLRYNAALLPRRRSRFAKGHSHTTTFDSGYLVPLMVDRVLPGDEKKITYNGLARMATPLHPVMDQAFFDVWCFYVPDRLWYGHAKEFYGENKYADFNPDGEYVMPHVKPSQYAVIDDESYTGTVGMPLGSLNDYFGMPVMSPGVAGQRDADSRNFVQAGLWRSYQLIWNEWFRNASIQPALQLNTGDEVTSEEWDVIKQIRKVNKLPDYFTTLLKEPQAGPDVLLPLGDYAPVVTGENHLNTAMTYEPLLFTDLDGRVTDQRSLLGISSDGNVNTAGKTDVSGTELTPANLWADLTNQSAATISNLRAAITTQHLLELHNMAGKRYQQIIQMVWGCLTGDSTLQRPELCGTYRSEVGMRQVLSTTETDTVPLGATGAYSLTNVNNAVICDKGFTEAGYLFVLGAIRPVISYSQGLNCLWTQLTPYEMYQPPFDGISNQPVYGYEIYMGNNATNEELHRPLGYKPAFMEYRIMQNRVSGLMRPEVCQTLSSWNYSLNFDDMPVLDSEFIAVDPSFMDRAIATPDEPQFIVDSYFAYGDTRSMSVNATPGIDKI